MKTFVLSLCLALLAGCNREPADEWSPRTDSVQDAAWGKCDEARRLNGGHGACVIGGLGGSEVQLRMEPMSEPIGRWPIEIPMEVSGTSTVATLTIPSAGTPASYCANTDNGPRCIELPTVAEMAQLPEDKARCSVAAQSEVAVPRPLPAEDLSDHTLTVPGAIVRNWDGYPGPLTFCVPVPNGERCITAEGLAQMPRRGFILPDGRVLDDDGKITTVEEQAASRGSCTLLVRIHQGDPIPTLDAQGCEGDWDYHVVTQEPPTAAATPDAEPAQ